MVIGSHLSIAKGFHKAGEMAVKIGANTFQFFTRNPRGGAARDLVPAELEALSATMESHGFGDLLAHAPYTLNLAASRPETMEFALNTLGEDLERVEALPCRLYNFHPGSHVGAGIPEGIRRITGMLNRVVGAEGRATLLLETMSGKGSEVGSTFGELADIMAGVDHPERFGVCLDTCHVYDAGYDIRDRMDEVLEDFDRTIGLDRLKAVHINDSMYGLGSRKDRHAGLGEGHLGMDFFVRLLTHPRLAHLPFFLETPYDDMGHRDEIIRLKEALDYDQKD